MSLSSQNHSLVLLFAQQRLCVQLQNEQVILQFPQDDGTVLEFPTHRKALRSLKCQLRTEQSGTRLILRVRDGSQCILDIQRPELTTSYLQDIRGAQQLLAQPVLTKSALKLFGLGALAGAVLLMIAAYWLVVNAGHHEFQSGSEASASLPTHPSSPTTEQNPEQRHP